jgi:hypothetical protein
MWTGVNWLGLQARRRDIAGALMILQVSQKPWTAERL